MTDRRTFLKKAGIAAATAVAAPIAANAMGMASKNGKDLRLKADESINSRLIVPHGNALPITGTFLDEISHDIPHQNWGEKEWDLDFRYMKAMGIDTVIDIRCGYRKFITYPSPYLLKKGCYMPSTDMIDMFCRLAQKYGMKFWLGLYDSGKYWDTGDMSYEVEANKYVRQCKEVSGGLPTFISPWIDGKKAVDAAGGNLTKEQAVSIEQHEREWNEIFDGIHEYVDACAFQDGHIDYDELDAFFSVNKKLADKYGMQCWTNAESFDRDMPIRFLPIKFDKLRMKLEAAKRCGYDKAITFEFSHFMSPQSAYLQAGHLYDRYMEYFDIR